MSHHPYKAETDFRELLRTPQRLFGYGYLYFLAMLLLLGILYAWNIGAISKNAVSPFVPRDSSAFVPDLPLKSPSVLPPVDVAVAAVPTDAEVARGRDLFRVNCSSCHGDNGMGDGPAGLLLNPRPRNFSSLTAWTNGSKVSQIYKTLQEGIVRNGMAAYNYMPPADRFALAHYIRSFAPGQPADTPEDLQLLENTYQLSKGSSTPAQIPVSKATRLVLAEEEARVALVADAARRVAAEKDDPGALLLQQVTHDPARVIASFSGGEGTLPEFSRFVAMVLRNPQQVGFTPATAGLNEGEWRLIYGYLSGLVATADTPS